MQAWNARTIKAMKAMALPALAVGAAWWLWVVLVGQVAERVVFPWDLLLWSESPFMTNMLKLHAGQPIYGPPVEGNSFVYSPGLEWVCHVLLSPIGRDLDIRWCRGLSVTMGLAAGAAMGWLAWRILAAFSCGTAPRWAAALLLPMVTLAFFRSASADVCHPDNLHALHLAITALLALVAIRTRRLGVACAAILFGATGMLAKQTAGLGGVAAAVAMAAAWQGWRTRVALAALSLAATGGVLAGLLQTPESRFWLLELLRQHPFHMEKFWEALFHLDAVRGILYFAALVSAVDALCRRKGEARRMAWLWLAMGLESLPALAAFGKEMGGWNNMGVIDLWAATMALPAGFALQPSRWARSAPVRGRLAWACGVGVLLAMLTPQRLAVPPALYRYGTRLDKLVAQDAWRQRQILLAHGTMPLIRAGVLEVPHDRANSMVELRTGGALDDQPFLDRLACGYYDRIYVNSTWYGTVLNRAIARKYRLVETLENPIPETVPYKYQLGYRLLGEVRVYEPKPAIRRAALERKAALSARSASILPAGEKR